jgi:hypothetical protein
VSLINKNKWIIFFVFFSHCFSLENKVEPQAQIVELTSDQQVLSWPSQIGLMYVGQWGYYVTFQNEGIRKDGSFKNWYTGPANMHFDKDSYDYNLILHTVAGAISYGYFRGFGNSKGESLLLSTISQFMFEFTIETITEPPSVQDMYQTPVFGAVLGMGLEESSLWLLNRQNWAAKALGTLINPFTLMPANAWQVHWVPIVASETQGGALVVRF